MNWTQINPIIEETQQPEFPHLPCYKTFSRFKQRPQRITYDKLMNEVFENTLDQNDDTNFNKRSFFMDVTNECGDDVLAYYRSFHRSQHSWGIYIIDAGVDFVAEKIMELAGKDNISLSRLDAEYLAKHKLLLHELGHHATEIVHTVLETDPNDPRLNSYREYIARKSPGNNRKIAKSVHDHEEAVCNWNVKKKKKHFGIRAQNYYSIARNFMLNFQPDGYRHFEEIARRNYLEKITQFSPSISKETKATLKKEFNMHSKLKMVMPLTKQMEKNAAIQVPIYLIRTVKQKKKIVRIDKMAELDKNGRKGPYGD